jgi:hypothetical protein
MDGFTTRRLPTIALALLILSISSALLLPLYSDDISWRFQLARILQDGWVDRFIGDSCGANTRVVPPLFMWPVRLVSSYWTGILSDPRVVRVAGVTLAIAVVLLFRSVVGASERGNARREAAWTLCCLLLALGVLPWELAMSRPEQPILLLLLGSVALAVSAGRRNGRHVLVASSLIAFFAIWSFSYHLKALFYLPTFLACLWITSYRRAPVWAPLVLTAIILGTATSAYLYWSTRFQCPADPIMSRTLDNENLASVLLRAGLPTFIQHVPVMLSNAVPIEYIKLALPNDFHTSSWLPFKTMSPFIRISWRAISFSAWAVALLLGASSLLLAIKRKRVADPRAIIALTLLVGLMAWGALQSQKNDYEAGLYLPLLLLAILLLYFSSGISETWVQRLTVCVAPIVIGTQIALHAVYMPQLISELRNVGYIRNQRSSIPVWTYPSYVPRALAAAAKCGIHRNDKLQRLLVDDQTYFLFARTYRPLLYVGVTEAWRGGITDPSEYLNKTGSSGAVLACKYLDKFPASRAKAIATGDICCLRGN